MSHRATEPRAMHILSVAPARTTGRPSAIGKRTKARTEGGEIAFRNRESNLRRRIVTLSLRRTLFARAERIELVQLEGEASGGIEERNESMNERRCWDGFHSTQSKRQV